MNRCLRNTLTLSAGLVLAGLPAAANAETYIATNWMATTHILNEFPYQKWAQDVKAATNGRIQFEVHSAGSLVPAKSTMQGIRDNVAVVGPVYPAYTPSEQPLNNIINDLVFATDDEFVAAFAYTELALTNPKLKAEWKKNGGLFLGGYATPVYNFLCMKPLRTPADAKGMKIRSAGTAQTDWVKALGGIPISVPMTDMYSGFERGSLDCALADPTTLDKGYRFQEVVKSVTELPMGVVVGAVYVYNPSFWKKLAPADRRILFQTMARAEAREQIAYHKAVSEALEGARKRGIDIGQPSDELRQKFETFRKDYIANLAKTSMSTRHVSDPSDLIKAYQALETKWAGLLKGVDRTNEEAVYKILYDNLYAKLDEKTFGL